jgi:hypothetical protein
MNRREVIKSLPVLLIAPIISSASPAYEPLNMPCPPVGRTPTISDAYRRLADEVNTDEDYRRAWVANIALLLYDMSKPEAEHTRQIRVELEMLPQRLIDPSSLTDCNYFAEQLLQRMFGGEKQ